MSDGPRIAVRSSYDDTPEKFDAIALHHEEETVYEGHGPTKTQGSLTAIIDSEVDEKRGEWPDPAEVFARHSGKWFYVGKFEYDRRRPLGEVSIIQLTEVVG